MRKNIKIRKNFADIDINRVSRILYEPYQEVPRCTDYVKDGKRKIILRNILTNELEQINYQLSGAVPFSRKPGYYWYWGEMETEDYHCCLTFYFNGDGSLRSISASLCGNSITSEEFAEANKRIKYAAEITKCGAF
ncbi:hypothetical protein IKF84_02120 [Candidatus Saccharibacteria bacterium]|nr:hypothetical protein [Candidatus Saccharibacteria bacterium]